MRIRSGVMFVLGGVTVLALGSGAAVAANGGAVLIGRTNNGSLPTTLNNPAGPALRLGSKPGTPPLIINDRTRVTNLDADLLDGNHASAFALRAGRTGIVVGTSDDADSDPSTARCPSGSVATGGGGYASGARDYLYYSGPDFTSTGTFVPNSWYVAADGSAHAWVVCYNPVGPVPGALTTMPDGVFDAGNARRRDAAGQRPARGRLP